MSPSLKAAIEEYERNMASGHSFYMDATTLMDIEEHYEREGMDYEAEHLMRFAEKLHPANPEVLTVKAYRLKARGKWTEALKLVKSIPQEQQGRDVQLFYADWEAATGFPDKATLRVERLLTPDSPDENSDLYINLVEILLDYGYYGRALVALSHLPEKHPYVARALELKAECFYQLQEYAKAQAPLEKLLDLEPYNANAWISLADLQQKLQNYRGCIESCEYALAIDPKNSLAVSFMAFSLFSSGRTAEGFALCEKYKPMFPDDYTLPMYEGEQYLSANQYDRATAPLERALRLCSVESPDRERLVTDLTIALACTHQEDRAREVILSLSHHGRNPVELLFQCASVSLECKRCRQAYDTLRLALNFDQFDDEARQKVVELLCKFDAYEGGLPFWKALENRPAPLELLSDLHPYFALAMYNYREREAFINHLQHAYFADEKLTVKLFAPIYGSTNINDLAKAVERDLDNW